MPALIDTSAVLAALDRRDPHHGAVVAALAGEKSSIMLPVLVLPEVAYLLQVRRGASDAAKAMQRLISGGWQVANLDAADLERGAELMARYADARVSFVDAAIAALAETLGAVRIYTLDRRDFAMIRPRHVDAFEVLPAAGRL